MSARLDAIRSKREALVRAPGARVHFGKYWDEWLAHEKKHGRATADAIAEIEAREAMSLPADYRDYLITIADGGIGPGCGLFALVEALAEVSEFTGKPSAPFPYGDAEATALLTKREQGDKNAWLDQPNDDGLPGGCLLLSHTGSGCFDVLVITGEQRGRVWFHDLQRLAPLGSTQKPLSFLDWLENWLDGTLRVVDR